MNNKYQPALFWFAVLNAVATFLLIGLGGLVTSHEAGMSVPDWPTSYGYNMFALPIKFWTGGAFFEHTHRLLASDYVQRRALRQRIAQVNPAIGQRENRGRCS